MNDEALAGGILRGLADVVDPRGAARPISLGIPAWPGGPRRMGKTIYLPAGPSGEVLAIALDEAESLNTATMTLRMVSGREHDVTHVDEDERRKLFERFGLDDRGRPAAPWVERA